jgi:hypothetical protein
MDFLAVAILANGAISTATDGHSNHDFNKLLREVAHSSENFHTKLSAIEQIVTGQVLAHSDAAKIALTNSMVFEGKKRRDEILRASHLFELCYAELANIPILGAYKAEVAFSIAMTHALLAVEAPEHKVLMNNWILISYKDFKKFMKTPKPEGETTQDKVAQGAGAVGILFGGSIGVSGVVTSILGLSGIGAPLALGILAISATSAKVAADTQDKVRAKEKLQKLYQEQISQANEALVDLNQIVAELPNQSSLPQIEE